MKSIRLTVAQAVIKYLNQQFVERDGIENKFFAGCFGILGHGNIAGMGQAIQQQNDLKYYQCRNEQSMVHTAAAYAKMKNNLFIFILSGRRTSVVRVRVSFGRKLFLPIIYRPIIYRLIIYRPLISGQPSFPTFRLSAPRVVQSCE